MTNYIKVLIIYKWAKVNAWAENYKGLALSLKTKRKITLNYEEFSGPELAYGQKIVRDWR